MEIIEKLTCSKCGETYLGRFILDTKGKLYCYDCDNKEYFGDLFITTLQNDIDSSMEDNEELLHEMYANILIEDVEKIYKLTAENSEDYTAHLYLDDGTLDVDKLYFQNNPVNLVITAHKTMLSLMPYLNKPEYKIYVQSGLSKYEKLRDTKLNENEINDMWSFLLDDTIQKLINSWS